MLTSHADSQPQEFPTQLRLSDEEYQSWQRQIDKVTLPAACFKLIYQLGQRLEARFITTPNSLQREVMKHMREPAVQPEEISDIHQSDDLLRLLPGELSVLGIDELEYEFYHRLPEKLLLTYRLESDAWRTRRILQPASSQQH